MKHSPTPEKVAAPTLQSVLDQIASNLNLVDTRKRDLRSAVISFSKLTDKAPGSIPLILADIRGLLDNLTGPHARISAKRRANLRSDLASAIEASGLHPMLRTSGIEFDPAWATLLLSVNQPRIRNGLSRFARWSTLNGILPVAVDDTIVDRFIDDLRAKTLVRHINDLRNNTITGWNLLAASMPELAIIKTSSVLKAPKRFPWESLPTSFRADVRKYLDWCAVPDALDDDARSTRLASTTLRLRLGQIHSAVTAAIGAGVKPAQLVSLANLIEVGTFKALLRKLYQDDGSVLTAYTHGVAGALITIASEWANASAAELVILKSLRRKLGALPSGLTEKNKSFLRRFEDTQLFNLMLHFPDKLWRKARRDLSESKRPFIDLQTALAIDILLRVPLRMRNLASLDFIRHLHWPNGRGQAVMLTINGNETKNGEPLEYELPAELADRLWIYRHEIAAAVTGERPDMLFVATTGKPRTAPAVALAIKKSVYKSLGIKLTPHQFRHFAAKIALDDNPSAYEGVKQLLGHQNIKTTINFYAGINTRRAGRAHAQLLMTLRNKAASFSRKPRRRPGKKGVKL
jgi:integrase